MEIIAALLVAAGMTTVVVALLARARAREQELMQILEMPFAEEDIVPEEVVQRLGLLQPGAGMVDSMLERLDLAEAIARKLESARIPLRPGEFGLGVALAAAAVSTWLLALSNQLLFGILGLVAVPLLASAWLNIRIVRREKAFEEQLPNSLSLIASSLQAGHTLLRAIQLLITESQPPISEEFERTVAETRLGVPLPDALLRMSDRIQSRDFEWVVHAVKIQQTVGGELAELLFTLADFMRDREEVRREVRVLTAEGRLSAYILSALPLFVAGWVQLTNPEYLSALFSGLGLVALTLGIVFSGIGLWVILRMVKGVEL